MDRISATTPRELARRWQSVLGRLQLELNTHNFNACVAGTSARSFDGHTLVVEAKSIIARDWLERRMRVVIERAAAQAFEGAVEVLFAAPGDAALPPPQAPAAGGADEPAGPRRPALTIGTVNCTFTFADYLTTRGNELAVNSCRAIVEPSDLVISPVVLYGSPGLGKTHLLHAVACRAAELGRSVACLSAEEFANRFLNAIRAGRANEFKEQLRTVDLLVIDDLQAIAGKAKTMDELVWTMEQVKHAGGCVVVASEVHPFELGLPERLESRLSEGIITRVEAFDLAERRAFVEHVARKHRVALPSWAIERLAQSSVSSARLLLGSVMTAMAMERNGTLTPAALDAAAGARVVAEAQGELGEAELLERIARHFGVTREAMAGRGRDRTAAEARAIATVALQERGLSLPRIGVILGGRDKSTMSPIARKGQTLLRAREDLRALIAG